MMKNTRWDNEVVLDYIEQHDPAAFKKHDEKILKKLAKKMAKNMLADKTSIEEIIYFTGLTKEEIEALQ